jgi:hypothetical protein
MGLEPTNLLTARLFNPYLSGVVLRRIAAARWRNVEPTQCPVSCKRALTCPGRDQNVSAAPTRSRRGVGGLRGTQGGAEGTLRVLQTPLRKPARMGTDGSLSSPTPAQRGMPHLLMGAVKAGQSPQPVQVARPTGGTGADGAGWVRLAPDGADVGQ